MVDLAVDAVKAVAELVAAQAWEEISLVWGFEDNIEKIKDKFLDIQAFIEDVGKAKHQEKSQLVNRWLQKVKDVAYFVGDVMDDYAYEIVRRKVKNLSHKKKMCELFTTCTRDIVFRYRMGHTLREILTKFDELDKEAKNIGLKQVKLAKEAVTFHKDDDLEKGNLDQVRKFAAANASEFVGRDDDEKELLQKLCDFHNEKRQLTIIAIVGIGGLGKTTLTRRLYEHEKVKVHFANKKAWTCVSEDFNVERLSKEIIESFAQNNCKIEELQGEEFLLVLDDVWNEDLELWDAMKNQLVQKFGGVGVAKSVILITTRSFDVAEKAGATYVHELEGLSSEESWELMKQRAFSSGSLSNVSSFEDVGKKIVRKCKGVPLAIKVVGGILRSKASISEWESVEGSDIWELSQDNKNYILPSLLLSYNNLPSLSLKQCFAYCAIFPKDHIMEKNELIDLWIAQGFLTLHETSNSFLTMEKMGEDYFKTLLNISFLQLKEDIEEDNLIEENKIREIWKCKMHDLVHDLAIHVFNKELLIWDVKADTFNNCRHLVLFDYKEEKSKALKDGVIQQVRTMNICSGKCPSWNVLTEARCLRTLIIVNKGIAEVPPTIGKLKHLRYLDLSSNPIETLPDSICKLYQLHALILLETRLKELPKELCKLVNLRRLTISACVCKHLPITDLGRLPNLRGLCLYWLPEVECIGEELNDNGNEYYHISESVDTTNKGNFIDVSSLENEFFPVLKELRILSFERLRKLNLLPPAKTTTIAVPFPCLEVLEIVECPNLEVVETSPTLSFRSLKCLYLGGIGKCQEPLDIIKYHKSGSLISLFVQNVTQMKSLPQSLSNCSRLETLYLHYCPKLVCLPSGLSSLVPLKHLTLSMCTALVNLPDDMFHGSSLSSLCELIIECCYNLVYLLDDMFKGLSSLHILEIVDCRRLEKIPTSVTECTSLEKLDIRGCKSLKHPIPDLSKLEGLVHLGISDVTCSVLEWIPHLPHLQSLKADVEHENDESRENTPSPRCLSYLTLFCNDAMTPPLHKHDSLKTISLRERSKNNQKRFKCLPQQLLQLHLPNLKSLVLRRFEELERLPEWIGTLSSLEEMWLLYCTKLRHLPAKKHLPQNLKIISIWCCPILQERISDKDDGPDSGSEWKKISHVPYIEIDDEIIQDPRK